MNRHLHSLLGGVAALGIATAAHAVEIDLSEWGFNIDGTTYCSAGSGCDNDGQGSLPGAVNASGFDFSAFGPTAGLGSIVITIGGAGAHSFDFYVDHDIDAATNTYFNETGSVSGAAGAGQSFEIDEPIFGDIFPHFLSSALDNTALGGIDDIAMAMGWDFVLGADEVATIELLISDMMPTSGFYLAQNDADSDYSIYLSGTLDIEGGMVGMPEPGSLLLVGAGLLGFAAARRRRR